MPFKVVSSVPHDGPKVSMRCPSCRQVGIFEKFFNVPDIFIHDPAHAQARPAQPRVQDVVRMPAPPPNAANTILGQRLCPNRECSTHVFCALETNGKLIKSFPVELIDFDSSKIPAGIKKTFEEALICLAEGCYIAAAIMVRRTLEELCEDKKAVGGDLMKRIDALRTKVILPDELFAAMHDLRLLGNDAAHIEAKTYDAIGKDELETAIEITKEILKSVYQLDSLLDRLKKAKKSTP